MEIVTTPPIVRRHIAEPSAWKADELRADPAWVYHLTTAEVAEIEAALQQVKQEGIPLLAIRSRNFPLPETSRKLREISWQLEQGRGIALLRGVPVTHHDIRDIEKIYLGISSYLGIVVAQNSRGDHVGHVRDEGLKWGQVSDGELVRGYRTNAYMPFHSDPTDRVALLCVQKAQRGGLSGIVSSTAIYNEIVATRPEVLDALFRGFYYSLRGEGSEGIAQITDHRVPLFDYFAGKLSSRYVRKTIEQGATVGGAPLTAEERAALDLVDLLAECDDLRFDMEFERGDIQYLNNHVAFHSRTGFEDHEDPALKRHLLRIWLQSPDARPLSPAMSRPHGSKSPFLTRQEALEREGLTGK